MMKGILIQQNHQLMEENMSNLTSASGEAGSVSSFASPISNPARKKRNLPGNPDPEAEVIALSPKSLMATNRFLCEICNKGFQRDQNLQLHRRGHNLPWKLKQRSSKEVRRKVYVCPEPSCVHHDPSRALGDLTGVKKHFSRKHGEKKWKCDKCSKKYAVQSDWKAHSKICGTREYRCDCGTIFSRRDSFITHRAFCDALAEESSRSITENAMAAHQYPLIFSQAPMMMMVNSSPADGLQELPLKRENHGQQQQLYYNISQPEVPPCHADLLPSSLYSHENPPPAAAAAHMSATALLQKAAQMGSTMSRPHHCQMAAHTTSASAASIGAGFGLGTMMTSLSGSGFDDHFQQGVMGSKREEDDNNMESFVMRNHGGGGEEKTRDFLGLRQFSHREILNLAALDPCMAIADEL